MTSNPKIANTTTTPVQTAIMVEIRDDKFAWYEESKYCKKTNINKLIDSTNIRYLIKIKLILELNVQHGNVSNKLWNLGQL